MTSVRGHVEITFGGQKRRLRVPIEVAPEIEEALGRGILDITRSMLNQSAKLSEVAEVMRVVMEHNGMSYDSAEVMRMVLAEGIMPSMRSAALVINELFKTGDDEKGKPKGKVKAPVNGATADSP